MNQKNLEQMIVVISIQITLAYLWILASIPKFFDAAYAQGFETSFGNTFLAAMPGGMLLQVYLIGILELLAGVLALVSIARLEFISNTFVWLRRSLAVGAVVFTILGFGLRLIQDFAGSANIFYYFVGIVILFLFVRKLERTPTLI